MFTCTRTCCQTLPSAALQLVHLRRRWRAAGRRRRLCIGRGLLWRRHCLVQLRCRRRRHALCHLAHSLPLGWLTSFRSRACRRSTGSCLWLDQLLRLRGLRCGRWAVSLGRTGCRWRLLLPRLRRRPLLRGLRLWLLRCSARPRRCRSAARGLSRDLQYARGRRRRALARRRLVLPPVLLPLRRRAPRLRLRLLLPLLLTICLLLLRLRRALLRLLQ